MDNYLNISYMKLVNIKYYINYILVDKVRNLYISQTQLLNL